jgi:hypothetical protein
MIPADHVCLDAPQQPTYSYVGRELMDMADWLWRTTKRKVMGQPTSAPSRQICLPCTIEMSGFYRVSGWQ